MSFAKLHAAQPELLGARIVTIESDIAKGAHAFTIVGLPDKAIEESRDRVAAAIKNSGWRSPKQRNHKITIALAPADQKKEGPVFDLGIALSYLLAAKDVFFDPKGKIFVGELALDGTLRPIRGALSITRAAKAKGYTEIYLPEANAAEAALIEGIAVYPVSSLKKVVEHLTGKPVADPTGSRPIARIAPAPRTMIDRARIDRDDRGVSFDDIRGQETAKRGLAIAAAGGHNIALYGPPGTGKSMLAKAFAGILPDLTEDEALEVTSIHSVAGTLRGEIVTRPPMRAPHHTSSYVSVIGGGTTPKPGEVTLAHHGVLFLDEFPEFDKRVIDALREPLEERQVTVARAKATETFPSRFSLIAAMNPCPCGYSGDRTKTCSCTPATLVRYRRKISGPIMDRIDIWIEVPRIAHETLSEKRANERTETEALLTAVRNARARQSERFERSGSALRKNADMSVRDIDAMIMLAPTVAKILNDSAKRLDLSPRSYHRIIKLSRTIADLAGEAEISDAHILEALQYRPRQQIA